MLLLPDARLDERRKAADAARGPLAGLYDSLAEELEPLLTGELYVPGEKALLSRAGGRCERDGATLEFDPFEPQRHRCAVCRTEYSGPAHHRAWITWYQLWLAERAVHAALFHALRGEERHATLARNILHALSDHYLTYPNRDNVLGPTRPFFSTYLESIWLLQVCVAADLLEQGGDRATAEQVRERIVEPSRALIAQFDEGMSNRQVWNNAALLASAILCRDTKGAGAILRADSGPIAHLNRGLLSDGTWFEGDNYHQFAVRGLWYVAAMCEANSLSLGDAAGALDRGIVATFLTALPDFTLPSRKDSQYAVSLRQWRFAELAELGYARRPHPVLADALARCYDDDGEDRDTARSRSTADAERNVPASRLTRANLGWRALLHALPQLPEVQRSPPASAHLTGQGLAIFRRPGDVSVALDYGQSGAGHGHPDRLNLLLSQGATRWLDDLGTGSYVDPSLHWYRSTLAHNAPMVDGRSQAGQGGRLLAHAETEDAGWIEASLREGDVTITRTVVAMSDYLVDELAWSAPRDVLVELPWHVDAKVEGLAFAPTSVSGGTGLEDGFGYARRWESAPVKAGTPVRMEASAGRSALHVAMSCDRDATLLRAEAPGQPASEWRPFYMVGARGKQGRFRAVVSWAGSPEVAFKDAVTVRRGAREEHEHRRAASGWRVEVRRGGGTRRIELAGRATSDEVRKKARRTPQAASLKRWPSKLAGWWSDQDEAARGRMVIRELGESNYRRSEETWREAGQPRATVAMAADSTGLVVFVDVNAWDQRFVPPDATNELDNEAADTMGAGVQLYVTTARGRDAWMIVPITRERVHLRRIAESNSTPVVGLVGKCKLRGDGYEMRIDVPLPDSPREAVDVDVVINEAPAGRVRRRGQLVTTDARNEFVYLRGDREEPGGAIRLELVR